MAAIFRTGLLIGVLTVAWMFVMGLLGWHTDPVLLYAFFLVIPIEIVLLVVGLRQTAARNGFGGQVKAGLFMTVIAAVIIFGGSLLFTTVAFPGYFGELREAHQKMLQERGTPAIDIAAEMQRASASQTPMNQALQGAAGTVGTGLITSLVAAAFLRRK